MTYDEEQAFNEFVERVESTDYDWFVTMTIPTVQSEMQADEYFDTWISVMEDVEGTGNFRWVRIAEKKPDDGSMVLHVLVGGRDTYRRRVWLEGWHEDVAGCGTAYSRRIPETPRLRNFLRYMVGRLGCGLRVWNGWGGHLHIRGMNDSGF